MCKSCCAGSHPVRLLRIMNADYGYLGNFGPCFFPDSGLFFRKPVVIKPGQYLALFFASACKPGIRYILFPIAEPGRDRRNSRAKVHHCFAVRAGMLPDLPMAGPSGLHKYRIENQQYLLPWCPKPNLYNVPGSVGWRVSGS